MGVIPRRTPRLWMTWTRRTRRIPTTASRSTPWPFRVEPRHAPTVGPTRSKNYYSAPRQRMLTSSVTRRAGRPQPPSSPRVASWLPSLSSDGRIRPSRSPGVGCSLTRHSAEASDRDGPRIVTITFTRFRNKLAARSLITLERRRSGHGGRHLHRHRRRRRAEVP